MDYDDNDFQSQNLHITGEGSNKYPPVLQPYALPKIDFGDSLNGHLRFDGLVETEVFLGIEGNEDNQWIEDFSRGSSSVVFRSSAAESCAIPRHDNVWSEATSSESVEMLLKSVGQDEGIAEQNTVNESDACDELGCIIKQMEPGLKHDGSSFSKVEAVTIPPVPSGGTEESSCLKKDNQTLDRDVSQTGKGNTSDDGDFRNLDSSISSENRNIVLKPRDESEDKERTPDQNASDMVVTESLRSQKKEDSCTPVMQNDNTASVQNAATDSSALNNQEVLQTKIDVRDCLPRNSSSDVEGCFAVDDKPSKDGELLASGGNTCLLARPDSKLEEVSDFQQTEGHGHVVDSKTPSETIEQRSLSLSTDTTIGDRCRDNLNRDSSEALGSDFQARDACGYSTVELGENPAGQLKCRENNYDKEKENLRISCHDKENAGSNPEVSLSSLEDNKAYEGRDGGNASSCEGGSHSSNVAYSSSDVKLEVHVAGTLEGKYSAFTDSRTDSTLIFSDPIELQQTNPHVSACPKQDTDLSSDSLVKDCEISGSSNEEKGTSFKARDTTFCEFADESLESKSADDKSGALKDQPDVLALPMGFKSLDKTKETGTISSSSGGLPILSTSSDMSSQLALVSASKKVTPIETAGLVLHEKVDLSLSAMDTCSKGQCGQQSEMQNEVCEESSQKIQVCSAAEGAEATDAEARFMLATSEKVNVSENQGEDLPKASEAEQTSERDAKPSLPEVSSVDKTCEDTAKDRGTTSVVGNTNADQITKTSTNGDSFKADNPTSSTPLSEAHVGSHVRESGEDLAAFGRHSPSRTEVRDPGLLESKTGTEKVQGLWDHSLPASVPMESQNLKENDTSSGEQNLTSKAADLFEKKAEKDSQPSAAQTGSKSLITARPSSTAGLERNDHRFAKDMSHGGLQVSDGEITRSHRSPKGPPDRKARRASKGPGKEASKKGCNAKETPPPTPLQSGNRTSKVTLGSAGPAQPIEMQHYSHAETGSLKPFGIFSTSVSSLPDLNSAGPHAIFQRPFTDLQQVQLRAQIFVYGALIQGTAPDEAYMISAFGGHDGGRSIWENAWRACIQRIHAQKLNLANPETPLQSRSGARGPDQTSNTVIQSKVASPAGGRASGKDTPVAASTMLPVSSPLWGMPTPRDILHSSGVPRGPIMESHPAVTSFPSHQTPPVKTMAGHNTSWISPTPFPGPWVASSQTNAFDTTSRFSGFPVTEAVQLTPVKEISMSYPSMVKHLSQGPVLQSGSSGSAIKGIPLVDQKKLIASPGQHSADPKSKKRKKVPVSVESSHIVLHSHSQIDSVSVPSYHSTSVSVMTPSNTVTQSTLGKIITSPPPSTLTHQPINVDHATKQTSILSQENLGKIKEARLHAEQASDLAAAAISHSQDIWKQIEEQNNSGLKVDVENRLASAAVAIATAAAVAKAAAAAANVASNAALQAKLMVDEILVSSASSLGNETSTSDGTKVLGKATPASILSGDRATAGTSSVLTAAKEAARKRVEAATAATKQAENVDAIVRAAELAAEAVSQAGKIVAMSDPLPLSELLKVGPESYWKVPPIPHTMAGKSDYSNKEHGNLVGVCPTSSGEHFKDIAPGDKEPEGVNRDILASSQEISTELQHVRPSDDVSGSASATGKKLKGQKGHDGSDSAKAVIVVPDSDTASASKESVIKEGSHVEVFKEGGGFKAAWYCADVLSIKDEKAYVCYADFYSDDGTEKLKEWVAIEGEGGEAPKIRFARSTNAMPFEGTRKRRRAAMGDYTWAVGDRVDAWLQDSWREGIITEKKKKNETTLTVNFPGQGEILSVKAWHLRPSLVWRDSKWIEFSASSGHKSPPEVDTPQEKRPRLKSPGVLKGQDKHMKDADTGESVKPHQPGLLDLAATERTFNIGRNTKPENKPSSLKMSRAGLQKEGSRVTFGVPKPGKKRKFMEVSKHYVAEPISKIGEPKDTVKFTKYLMPQTSGSRGWKNTSKTDLKEKRSAVSKPKVFKPGKTLSVSGKMNPKENDMQKTKFSAVGADAAGEHTTDGGDSIDRKEKTLAKHNLSESQSISGTEGVDEDSSSHDVSSDAPERNLIPSKKGERAYKGKIAPGCGRLASIEEEKVSSENFRKPVSDSMEPRRSNRRIQPTSRLLEGLQSSLIISKIPSASHERGHKSQNKTSSRGK